MTLSPIATVILVAHWLIIIGLSLRVIERRAAVGVSLAWLAVVFSTPFVGIGAYLLFGEKRLSRRRAARIAANARELAVWQQESLLRHPRQASMIEAAEPIGRLAEQVFGFPAMAGNDVELLHGYERIFDAIVADIDRARESCQVCFYIWHDGGRTSDVAEALIRAAGRGVRCRALGDAVGSQTFLAGATVARLRTSGVAVLAALPTGPLQALFSRTDLRNHRKIIVVDDRVAYTGSQNLADPRYFMQDAGAGEWVDAMVRVSGPAVAALDGVFELDWAVESGARFEPPGAQPEPSAAKGSIVQAAPSGPYMRPEGIHQLLLTAIYAARRELIITTPYFIPDESMLTALLSAALRGVAVTLIVPARSDSLLIRYAGVAHFDDLLSAGVRIAQFKDGLLHTKSLTIDGDVSVFGSVNLDMRSLWLNFEISLLVYDRDFTGRLRALQGEYLADSEELELEAWRRRPRSRRLAENTLRLLGPLL